MGRQSLAKFEQQKRILIPTGILSSPNRMHGGVWVSKYKSKSRVCCFSPFGKFVAYSFSVVFVHGLRGHRSRTWTKGSVQWIKDYLPVDIPDIRVLSFGYDANILNLFQPSSTNNVHYHAKALLDGLLLHRQNCSTVRDSSASSR